MKQDHHYFASFGLGWATADTAKAAIEKLMLSRMFRSDVKKAVQAAQKRGEPGAYVWTCKVHAPSDAKYSINFYMPEGIEKSEGCHHYVTYITAKELAYYTPSEDHNAQV